MTPPADEALVFDIEQMKELGFNMLRKHVKIEPARWYYHCDRIGMVVWQDMVNGGGPVPKLLETYLPTVFPAIGTHLRDDHYRLLGEKTGRRRKRFERDLSQMIRQLYNCPCIGMWVPFNEGWGQFDALRITDRIRQEDPTRPVDHASGWFDQGGGDVRSVHNYFRPLAVEEGQQGVRDLRVRGSQLPDRGTLHERRGVRIPQCDSGRVPEGFGGCDGKCQGIIRTVCAAPCTPGVRHRRGDERASDL